MTDPMPLTDADEVLRRQVPPGNHDEVDGPLFTAFMPNRTDEGKMSTLRERVDPQEAYRRHTEDFGRHSVGTWGVVVGAAQSHRLDCIDDELIGDLPADHASVDFNKLTRLERKTAGGLLRDAAVEAGVLYVPAQP